MGNPGPDNQRAGLKSEGRGRRMQLRKVEVTHEIQRGQGAGGLFYREDVRTLLPRLLKEYAGKVQLIYLDPPFQTGHTFSMRVRVGEKEWKSGNGTLNQSAYDDSMSGEKYLEMMRQVLTQCKKLLSETGVIYLHIDYRMHAHLRLMMDEIFGESNLLNEIIWTYQTGGRARRYFSRKHDIILFYRRSPRYYFNIEAVPINRVETRRNHMKKHVDPDGRVYRSIRSGGKIYTYYDDEPAYPGDVWDDVSHLQQKDPQRTGYDTQKPLKLLERIILSSSRPGDLVMDFFSGSGTSLEAAMLSGRRFVGGDVGAFSLQTVRRRLVGCPVEYFAPACPGQPAVSAEMYSGIAYYEISLTGYVMEGGVCARNFSGLDAVDGWSAGYLRGGEFLSLAHEMRSKQVPALKGRLEIPVLSGEPCIRVSDVMGRYFYYVIE